MSQNKFGQFKDDVSTDNELSLDELESISGGADEASAAPVSEAPVDAEAAQEAAPVEG